MAAIMLKDQCVTIRDMVEVVVTILNVRDTCTFEHSWRVRLLLAYSGQTGHRFRSYPDTLSSDKALEFHYTFKWPE